MFERVTKFHPGPQGRDREPSSGRVGSGRALGTAAGIAAIFVNRNLPLRDTAVLAVTTPALRTPKL